MPEATAIALDPATRARAIIEAATLLLILAAEASPSPRNAHVPPALFVARLIRDATGLRGLSPMTDGQVRAVLLRVAERLRAILRSDNPNHDEDYR